MYLHISLLYYSVDSYHQYTFERDFGLWVHSNGSIHWAYGGQFSVNCELNLIRFPFDSQNCNIIVESWLHNSAELTINVLPTATDTQVIPLKFIILLCIYILPSITLTLYFHTCFISLFSFFTSSLFLSLSILFSVLLYFLFHIHNQYILIWLFS